MEKVLWNTDPIYSNLSALEKAEVTKIEEVKARCRERLLAHGFTSALGDRFDYTRRTSSPVTLRITTNIKTLWMELTRWLWM